MTTGELLRELRNQRKLTQEEVAIKNGIALTTYARYELGLRLPKTTIATKLANFYGITVGELLMGKVTNRDENDEEAWQIRERLRRDPDYRILFDAAGKASPEHLRAAAAMLKALEGDN